MPAKAAKGNAAAKAKAWKVAKLLEAERQPKA
jgi:hypothetical protein